LKAKCGALFGGLLALACGSDDSNGASGLVSCTVSVVSADVTAVQICMEASGSAAAQMNQTCASQAANLGGSATALVQHAAGPCSRVNALGGCEYAQQGSTITTWWYRGGADGGPDQTSEDIALICSQTGARFIPP
jgi:hypothetical protein